MSDMQILEQNIEPVNVKYLEEGDHIFRFGAFFEKSLLSHHGIYIGNDQVIHFSGGEGNNNNFGDDIKNAKIKITTIDDFLMNKYQCWKIKGQYTLNQRSEIVSRAFSKLDTDFGGYSPANNNCEHFANWCRTGYKISKQTSFISDISKYVISHTDINQQKLNDVLVFSNEFKKIIKPLEALSGKVTLVKSLLDIVTDVILKN